ncbi:MAG: proline dehydrogenase family protein [Nitritalea sp.]
MTSKPKLTFENLEIAFQAKSDAELRKMYVIFATINNNTATKLGIKLANLGFSLRLPIKGLMKQTMFGHFCGGETIEECGRTVQELADFGIGTILDYSVEGKGNEASYEATFREVMRTVERAAGDPAIPFAVFKVTGLGDYRLMIKKQAGEALSPSEQEAYARMEARVDALCAAAQKARTKILIDAEESWFQDSIDALAYAAMERYNQQDCIVYNTYQMYRHDMYARLEAAYAQAEVRGYYLGAKLVRGAYMEKERERAAKKGYASPIQATKADSDRDYDKAMRFCLDRVERLHFVSGSHNEQSNLLLAEWMLEKGLEPGDARVYFAQLYGMSDTISFNLAHAGFRVAKYVPYGPVEKVMPYLSRRAAENTSVAGQSSREFELIKKELTRRKAARSQKEPAAANQR